MSSRVNLPRRIVSIHAQGPDGLADGGGGGIRAAAAAAASASASRLRLAVSASHSHGRFFIWWPRNRPSITTKVP